MIYKLLRATQTQARELAIQELKKNGYTPKVFKDFIYAEGSVPVLLVAHYDTVLKEPPKKIKNTDGVLSSPVGLGADDRAGMYAILEIVKKHHCHVLFTGGEEVGGIGARAFKMSNLKPNVNYIIELDRRGSNDAVYYEGANEEFEDFITSHGWKTASGTFTDICVLAPYLGVAAVNLSIGYSYEHQKKETLDTKVLEKNIKRVQELLSEETKFEWIEAPYRYDSMASYWERNDERDLDLYIIEYKIKGTLRADYGYGRSSNEALGDFFTCHPDLCFKDVVDFYNEDSFYREKGWY